MQGLESLYALDNDPVRSFSLRKLSVSAAETTLFFFFKSRKI